MAKYLVTGNGGKIVLAGDEVTDFRGDVAIFNYVSRGPDLGKSAKVIVTVPYKGDGAAGQRLSPQQEYYAGVFGLVVTPVHE